MLSASLVKEINTTLADASPANFVVFNGDLYFTAKDGVHGTEIWRSDGTVAGTVPLPGIAPVGRSGSLGPSDLTVANGSLYFFAMDPIDAGAGTDLWKTNGTAAGTVDLGTFNEVGRLVNANGILLFSATDLSSSAPQTQLWRSDGTAAGTFVVRPLDAAGSYPIGNFNGFAYFLVGGSIWKSDGTSAGTVQVLTPPNTTGTLGSAIDVNGTIFFSEGRSLWATDGVNVRDVHNFTNGGVFGLMNLNGTLYFGAEDASFSDAGLWTSDGTSAGTHRVATGSVAIDGQDSYAVFDNRLYYAAADDAHGVELWTSDGTAAGTTLVDDIDPGPDSGMSDAAYGGIIPYDGALFLAATDGTHGAQLWRSDGTAPGTVLFDQINPTHAGTGFGGGGPNSQPTATIDGITYFAADDQVHGLELWKTDGTPAGTSLVDDIQPGPHSSGPNHLFDFNGTLYFDAGQGDLWKSDGTAAGTTQVAAGLWAFNFTALGSSLYFFGNDPAGELDLMKLDGPTGLITTIMPVQQSSSPSSLVVAGMGTLGGALYFTAINSAGHSALWRTDGTTAGTSEVMAFAGPTSSVVRAFPEVNGSLYFVANDGTNGPALWKTDGTAAGTTMVWTPGANDSTPANLYAVGNAVYFNVYTFSYGFFTSGVYRSDGTAAGTVELESAASYQDPAFTTAGGKLYFLANAPGRGTYTVYTTDGTAAGTTPLDPGLSVAPWTSPPALLSADERLYFIADDGTHGNQLWQANGTTTAPADPSETAAGWAPTSLMGVTRNGLAFAGTDAAHGNQLWSLPLAAEPAAASFVRSDSSTGGTWAGSYGSDGYDVIGGGTSLPAYASMDVLGSQYWQWAAPGQADGRAPVVDAGQTAHVAATDFSGASFTVDLNLDDSLAHQVAFYVLDYDALGRSETVTITNADTGQVLDTRSVNNFQNGQYLVYTLSGHVDVTFTNAAGSRNAVLSAVLFDPPPAATATAAYAGYTRLAGWVGQIGSQGYDVIGGDEALPAYASVTTSAAQYYFWGSNTGGDSRLLQVNPQNTTHVAACDYSNAPSFSMDVNLTDGNVHQVTLYLLDYDARGRAETLQLSDAATGTVLDTRLVTNFAGGLYLSWNLSGDVKITIGNAGGLNEVVSGLFIDPPHPIAAASFAGADLTTQGNWTSAYGHDGYDVINGAASMPAYATMSVDPAGFVSSYTWAAGTNDARALQTAPGSLSRIAACDYTNEGEFELNFNFTDGRIHRVALYFLDYDNQGRVETVNVTNGTSGATLDSEKISKFQNGEYLAWNVSGNVSIHIINSGGLNPVVSGIFFG